MENRALTNIVEAALLAAGEPLSLDRLLGLFDEGERPDKKQLREAITQLQDECQGRGIELKEVGSGYRFQARQEMAVWVGRLWDERPARYSRALLETLALIAYRQPITRAEIEDIRGVAVSSNIVKTLLERGWVRVVGHRDVPGRPALYATTREFLDYFSLTSLDELPTLAELRDLDKINAELDLRFPGEERGQTPDEVAEAVAEVIHPDALENDSESKQTDGAPLASQEMGAGDHPETSHPAASAQPIDTSAASEGLLATTPEGEQPPDPDA